MLHRQNTVLAFAIIGRLFVKHRWAESAAPKGGGIWLRDARTGNSAFLCTKNGRIHLFQDYGNSEPDPTDDFGYILISDLAQMIDSLSDLEKCINELIQVPEPPFSLVGDGGDE